MIDIQLINNIRNEIAQVITDQSTLFEAVYAFPKATISGYPSLMVMPVENEAEYETNIEDRFIFKFNLITFYPIPKEEDYEKAEIAIGECMADLLNIFSKKDSLTTVDWVKPVPTIWEDTAVGDTPYRIGVVNLRCTKIVDIT